MIGHAERPSNVCDVVWSLSESEGVGLEESKVDLVGAVKGSNCSRSGGLI